MLNAHRPFCRRVEIRGLPEKRPRSADFSRRNVTVRGSGFFFFWQLAAHGFLIIVVWTRDKIPKRAPVAKSGIPRGE